MNQLHDLLTIVIALNEGGRVVGKTRLQKIVYLLDECGLSTGCRYDYHYFGPFSSEIAEAAEDAFELGKLKYDERPGFHAVPYGIYEVADRNMAIPATIGGLSSNDVKSKLALMSNYSAIELDSPPRFATWGTMVLMTPWNRSRELGSRRKPHLSD